HGSRCAVRDRRWRSHSASDSANTSVDSYRWHGSGDAGTTSTAVSGSFPISQSPLDEADFARYSGCPPSTDFTVFVRSPASTRSSLIRITSDNNGLTQREETAVRHLLRLFSPRPSRETQIQAINKRRNELTSYSDEELKKAGRSSGDLIETIAITAVVAAR